ncbi:MAG: transposase [Saprospiraceae bacterium]|nr:transposase [Saprospiraceae bacterium]
MFNDLKLRRVQDILFLFSDNLTGLQQAVDSCFPTSTLQIRLGLGLCTDIKVFLHYKYRRCCIGCYN